MKFLSLLAGLSLVFMTACGDTKSSSSAEADGGIEQKGVNGYWFLGIGDSSGSMTVGIFSAVGNGQMHMYSKCYDSTTGKLLIARIQFPFDAETNTATNSKYLEHRVEDGEAWCLVRLNATTFKLSLDQNGNLKLDDSEKYAVRTSRDSIYNKGFPSDKRFIRSLQDISTASWLP